MEQGDVGLVGRDAEQREIARVLDLARRRLGGALVLIGEAGSGKTALLREGAAAATDLHVLTAAGTEAEVALPFAGLHALLSPLLMRLGDIPAPQAAALSAAFELLAPETVDTFGVAAGALSLLVTEAAGAPVLVLVDDLHKFDRASREALLFVGRRLSCQGIGLVCATRTDGPEVTGTGLPHRRVAPLDRAASRELLDRSGGGPVAPAVADQLVTAAEGLPLALVELPTLLNPAELSGEAPLRNPLPAGPRVCDAYVPLVEPLGPASRSALVVAAAAGDLSLAQVLAAVSRLDGNQAALEAAEAAGVVRLSSVGVSFRTALARAVIYQRASATERRAVHAALAQVTEAGRRAHHLGLATLGADEDVAGEIEALALQASRRSGPAAAAQLMEQAAELSVADDRRAHRQALAAELWQHAAVPRVLGLLDRAIRLSGDLQVRGHVQAVRGRQELLDGRPLPAHRLLVHEAARVRAADPGRAATMLADAAQACCLAGQSQAGLVMARHAWLLTRQASGLPTAVVAAQLAAVLSLRGDLMAARELVDEWTGPLDDAAGDDGVPLEYRRIVQLVYPGVLLRLGELDQAWRVLDAALYQCRLQRMTAQLPGLLAARAQLDLRLGEWESAQAAAAQALRLARDVGQLGDEVAALVASRQAGRQPGTGRRMRAAAGCGPPDLPTVRAKRLPGGDRRRPGSARVGRRRGARRAGPAGADRPPGRDRRRPRPRRDRLGGGPGGGGRWQRPARAGTTGAGAAGAPGHRVSHLAGRRRPLPCDTRRQPGRPGAERARGRGQNGGPTRSTLPVPTCGSGSGSATPAARRKLGPGCSRQPRRSSGSARGRGPTGRGRS